LRELTALGSCEGGLLKAIQDYVSPDISRELIFSCKGLFAEKSDSNVRFNDIDKRITMFNTQLMA
jgi:hypothetical protein